MNKEQFIYELKKININITEFQLNQLDKYYKLLVEWNKKINLTRIIKEKDVYLKHFYDSLTIAKSINLNDELELCDVGTGAGLPGIVLKIVYPNLKITLIDSLNKRILFLKEVIEKLNLKNIEVVHSRIEDYSKITKEKYDIVTSRAVARTEILSEISSPLLKIGGSLILMKGSYDEELISSQKILNSLKLKLKSIDKFLLPIENSNRTIVIIEKIEKTPDKYPRSIDKIKKSL